MKSHYLTQVQHTLLMAILLDGKDILSPIVGRKRFDDFLQSVMRQDRVWLYTQWKEINKNLVQGGPIHIPVITNPEGTSYTTSDPKVIRWLRQVFGLFTRLEEGDLDTTSFVTEWSERVRNARAGFSDKEDAVLHHARRFILRILGANAPSIWSLQPKHGPGSVATGEKGREKQRFTATYTQLDQLCQSENPQSSLGSLLLFHLNFRHAEMDQNPLTVYRHPFTKVVAVPKDMMKPRIISAEPLSLQYLQQGLMKYMVDTIERRCSCIHFSDQRPNQLAAKDLSNATLDMSNASDLVSRRLVLQLFPEGWKKLLFSLRSHFARTPDGILIPLRCFAPMGSAICFPVEAVVFASIAYGYLQTQKASEEDLMRIHVFGDDIIVPIQYAGGLITCLRKLNMVPNVSKCCHAYSLFRESCGAEWFCQEDVTVLRPKTLVDTEISPFTPQGVPPMVGHANKALSIGYSKLAQAFADLVHIPVAIGDGPAYAAWGLKWSCCGRYRWNSQYQRMEQRALAVVASDAPVLQDFAYSSLHMGLTAKWASHAKFGGRTRLAYVWYPTTWVSDLSMLNRLPLRSREVAFRVLNLG